MDRTRVSDQEYGMSWLNGQVLDLAVALVVLWRALVGYRDGLVATAYGLVGQLLVLVAAWRLAPRLSAWREAAPAAQAVRGWVAHEAVVLHLSTRPAGAAALGGWVVQAAAFLLLYVLFHAVLGRLVWAFSRTVNRVPLFGGANRLGGALAGAVATVLAAAIFLVLLGDAGVSWHWPQILRAEGQSQIAAALLPVGHSLLAWLRYGLPHVRGLAAGGQGMGHAPAAGVNGSAPGRGLFGV